MQKPLNKYKFAPPPLPEAENQTPTGIAFYWLLLLRWGAVVCQITLIAAVHFILRIDIPVAVVSFIIVFEALSNIYFAYLHKRNKFPDWLFVVVMFLDVSLLTLLIYYTGGPMNPFTFLYLVHIVVAAMVMRPKRSWSLAGFTTLCYALLFFVPITTASGDIEPLCHVTPLDSGKVEMMKIHLQGMWLAFAMTTVFVVYFVSKIQQSLEHYQATLLDLQDEKTKSEKLTSLATLAAGAAHEFATPLSTIAVAAGEMHHFLVNNDGDQDLIEDTRLIRSQIDKCKDILYQMSADAGEPMGEPATSLNISEFIQAIAADYGDDKIIVENLVNDLAIHMPPRTLRRTIKGLINNAIAVIKTDDTIKFSCSMDDDALYFEVQDNGIGMDEQTLKRAMEPFFTTKQPGKGLGLGLFLVRSVAERYGGGLYLDSEPGKGTRATLSLALKNIDAG